MNKNYGFRHTYRQHDDWRCEKINWFFKDKKRSIQKFQRNHLTLNSNGYVNGCVENLVPVGSYNWAKQSTPNKPVIIVPGIPHYNIENQICQKLEKSKTQRVCNESKYYMSKHPMEPMFQAVLLCTPEYDFNSVDLITDCLNLRKLFDFIEGNAMETFRIDIQMNENGTLLFICNDENVILPCTTYNNNDYSADFKNKFTENRSNEAGSYWKIVTYMLGSIRVMCQVQVDCVENNGCLVQADVMPTKNEPIAFNGGSGLFFIKGGDFSYQQDEKFVFLTTKRTFNGSYNFPLIKWSHLLFFNIDIMVLGWHDAGVLNKVEKMSFEEVSERCGRQKEQYQKSLGKLFSLIMLIKEKIKNCSEHEGGFAVVFDYSNDKNSLELVTVYNSSQVLPHELKMRVFK